MVKKARRAVDILPSEMGLRESGVSRGACEVVLYSGKGIGPKGPDPFAMVEDHSSLALSAAREAQLLLEAAAK